MAGTKTAANEMKFILMVAFFMVVLGQLVPFFGSTFEGAQGDLGATSEWNASYNTDMPSTADTWGKVFTITGSGLGLLSIIVIAKPIVGDMFTGKKGSM
jgi:hypothetical protein